MIEDSGRGWRKVVASPRPLEIIGLDMVRGLLDRRAVVIAGGGGGIPVTRREGDLEGVEAVIDKDRTAALLAIQLGAELLAIVTDVPEVYADFGTDRQRALRRITVSEARKLLAEGQFPAGSMGPKIESSADFAAASGGRSIITDAGHLLEALEGESGTTVSGA